MSDMPAEENQRDAEKLQLAELTEFMTRTGVEYLLLFVAEPARLPDQRLVEAMVQSRRTQEALHSEFERRHKERAKGATDG